MCKTTTFRERTKDREPHVLQHAKQARQAYGRLTVWLSVAKIKVVERGSEEPLASQDTTSPGVSRVDTESQLLPPDSKSLERK